MNFTSCALVYSPNTTTHDTGYFEIEEGLLYHHLNGRAYLDEVYKPYEINYPYPFPNRFRHPENSLRLEIANTALENWELLSRFRVVEPLAATEAELLTTHSATYLNWLQDFCPRNPGAFAGEATPIASQSYQAATLSAGAALTAGRLVLSGAVQRALALTRPPGHHASRAHASGFCLLNNAAILANYALTQPDIKRVLIVDWDVHHGNGTQEIFWQNRQVLFNSFHQFGPGVYPESGQATEIGAGEGQGYSVNVPLPAGCPDQLYLEAFERVTTALAAQFRPDLIIVSAGQDGHFNDLRHLYLWEDGSGFNLTAQHYYHLTRHIIKLADTYSKGRCVFVQEGGYNLNNFSNSLLNIGAALLDLPLLLEEHLLDRPSNKQVEVETVVAPVQANLKGFWDFS